MSRFTLVAVAGLLLCIATVTAEAQTSEPVRINVKETLIEISLSQDAWWLRHGWVAVRADVTEGMSEEQVRTFLLQYYLFELTVDGVAVTADAIPVGLWDPDGQGEHWMIEWQYDLHFTSGIHTLVGTWTIRDVPCTFGDEGDCDPPSADYSPWAGRELLQPPTLTDGLSSIKQRHTLTLSVLP